MKNKKGQMRSARGTLSSRLLTSCKLVSMLLIMLCQVQNLTISLKGFVRYQDQEIKISTKSLRKVRRDLRMHPHSIITSSSTIDRFRKIYKQIQLNIKKFGKK